VIYIHVVALNQFFFILPPIKKNEMTTRAKNSIISFGLNLDKKKFSI